MKKIIQFLILIVIVNTVSGCKKDEDPVTIPPVPTNETEIMTTFKLIFTDSAGFAPTVTAEYRDPDGDGGNPAVQFDTIKLLANKTYFANAFILDETKNPVDTISNEVMEEANDHLFFYTTSGFSATVAIVDFDTHNPPLPVGLQTKWKTMGIGNGTVQVVLRHQPNIKDGMFAPGETDIDLVFSYLVQ
ncbi:MAG: hypothetical protein V4608_08320 [Bacteroidota bacterium]